MNRYALTKLLVCYKTNSANVITAPLPFGGGAVIL